MKIGDQVGRYRTTDVRPDGANGIVFKAVCLDDPNLIVAIKECNDLSESGREAFEYEIKMTKLQLLPGRMPLFYCEGEFNGVPYFVMSWSENLDTDHMTTHEAVEVSLFLIDCAIALRDTKPGYLYGDFKPSNVGIENGHYVLRDWATCRTMADANFQKAIVGTPYYRSRTLEYTGIGNERTEINALGMSFLAMLPLVRRIVYGPAILLAISPGFGPFKGIAKLEEFRKLIVSAQRSFFGLVWLVAGVWKTSIACMWAAITVGTILLILLTLFFASEFQDSKVRKEEYRKRHPELLMKECIWEGFIDYKSGDLPNASNNLHVGITSPHFKQEHFPFDVLGLYQDACRRLATGQW